MWGKIAPWATSPLMYSFDSSETRPLIQLYNQQIQEFDHHSNDPIQLDKFNYHGDEGSVLSE